MAKCKLHDGRYDDGILLPPVPAPGERSVAVRRLCVSDLPDLRHAARARGRSRHRLRILTAALWGLAMLLVSCSSRPAPPRAVGVAYAGPATLNLRKDLASKSALVGTATHGDRLEVLETRRRLVLVRTAQGVTGWTDGNLLLSQTQMDDLQHLADSASKLPSLGAATVFESLNMHTEPSLESPSFFQIPEAGRVDVLGHRATPRTASSAPHAAPVRRVLTPKKAKGKNSRRTASSGPAPPLPALPPPPKNWMELSRPHVADLPGYVAPQPIAVSLDDWNLVRTRDGKVGWVLARMLNMAIPDEVAQYAEGHRITSYLPLGEVKDQNVMKPNWLWTTIASGEHGCDFDSFRVFVWSTRHHRYETAYIERNVTGFFPVETKPMPGQEEKAFSVVLQDKDGVTYKRTYGFSGFRVRMISKTPYQAAPSLSGMQIAQSFEASPAQDRAANGGWKQKWNEWWKRWAGH